MEERLNWIKDVARSRHEDAAYTRQYFTIGRQAHVRSTQSFGPPALVWHVGFWPMRGKDPHDLEGKPTKQLPRVGNGTGSPQQGRPPPAGDGLTREAARSTYDDLRYELAEDLDKLLERLQGRGRVPDATGQPRIVKFGAPEHPADWENGTGRVPQVPVKAYRTESIAFTMWWSNNKGRPQCPAEPPEADLRVRVQADIHADFATVTFIIDAGKPWDTGGDGERKTHHVDDAPLQSGPGDGDADEDALAERTEGVPGSRRKKIFRAARIVRQQAATALAKRDADKPSAAQLRWASELLHERIWKEFSEEFGCWLTDIAGGTDEIFANFRGVMLAAPSNPETPGGKAPHLKRFVYGASNGRGSLDEPYPNQVVTAYWPFIRRTRSEADNRDWIACGVFDWRALYITALGGRSDFDPGDERKETTDLTLPRRSLKGPAEEERVQALAALNAMQPSDAATRDRIEALRADLTKALQVAGTPQGDLPRPFHYLFLTADEPNRRQAGRMVDRVNLLGTIRLYAMKDFSIIRDADVHLRIFGQLLDEIMRKSTDDIREVQAEWWGAALRDAQVSLQSVWSRRADLKSLVSKDSLPRIQILENAHATCARRLAEEVGKLPAQPTPGTQDGLLIDEEPLMLYRRLLADIVALAPKDTDFGEQAESIFAVAQRGLNDARQAKSRHDEQIGLLNRRTDLHLTRIKSHIDELGRDAIGGLPFRINRARYYAAMYRTMVKTLRVGSIDTWWDYVQLASRGVDPPLRFIEDVGDRLEKLRSRLRDAMEAVQTSAIANQTEATRDNTYQLEVIAVQTRKVVEALVNLMKITEDYRAEAERTRVENEQQRKRLIRLERWTARLKFWSAVFASGGIVTWLWNGGFSTILSWLSWLRKLFA